MSLTEDQIIGLAPDASSIKSGKDLAVASKWVLRGASDKALWGHCQGSGKLPYQSQVDLQNIAFKCSCPSHKFPCKHGLALLLLYARGPELFTKSEEPEWVSDWLNKRTERVAKKVEKESKPVDVDAQAKRAGARARKVAGGIEDLQVWLKDLIRNGLLTLPERSYEYWQQPSKRMVDAQAPGLAGMVKALGDINYFDDSWKHKVLNQLSRIFLVSEAYKNLDTLPEDFQKELRLLVGFTQSKEELLAQEGVSDHWLVLARTLEEDEQLTIERNWLYGINNKRFALILQFFVNRQLPELSFMPGTAIDAELVFYQGVQNQRALMKQQKGMVDFKLPGFHETIARALESFSGVIIQNPFYERVPLLMGNVRFVRNNQQYYFISERSLSGVEANNTNETLSLSESKILDSTMSSDRSLSGVKANLKMSETDNTLNEVEACKVAVTTETVFRLLAVTGGRPCNMFVLADENEVEPMAVWVGHNFIPLNYGIQK